MVEPVFRYAASAALRALLAEKRGAILERAARLHNASYLENREERFRAALAL